MNSCMTIMNTARITHTNYTNHDLDLWAGNQNRMPAWQIEFSNQPHVEFRGTEIATVNAAKQNAIAPKILVAEDADDLRDAIVLVLVERGYRVQAARDGHEASLMFPEFAPDLVVLDMRMPKMSGPNTCAAIRKTSNVPVIMFTSTNDATEVKDAILKGATDFVLKTTGVVELTDRIAYHLDKSTAVEQSVKAKTVSVAPNQKIATTTLIVDPDDQVRAAIAAILTRLNQNVIEASTAAEAIVRFKQGNPDIVITERTLPDMDGFNMFKELNTARDNKGLLKLMMSTRLSPEANRKAHFAGITNFLNKPLDSGKVEMMVADCVRKALRVKKQRIGNAA